MNFTCNVLLYRMVTLHQFLIRLLAKKEMMISLFISIIFRRMNDEFILYCNTMCYILYSSFHQNNYIAVSCSLVIV